MIQFNQTNKMQKMQLLLKCWTFFSSVIFMLLVWAASSTVQTLINISFSLIISLLVGKGFTFVKYLFYIKNKQVSPDQI